MYRTVCDTNIYYFCDERSINVSTLERMANIIFTLNVLVL